MEVQKKKTTFFSLSPNHWAFPEIFSTGLAMALAEVYSSLCSFADIFFLLFNLSLKRQYDGCPNQVEEEEGITNK